MYVLILGLDVLGNPFGFIRGLSEGVEAFFYEPYQVKFSAALLQVDRYALCWKSIFIPFLVLNLDLELKISSENAWKTQVRLKGQRNPFNLTAKRPFFTVHTLK